MADTTLTFTADEELVRRATEAAQRQHTDLTSLLQQYLAAVAAGMDAIDESSLPPITRRALGMFQGLPNRPYKELVAEAITERYGLEDR